MFRNYLTIAVRNLVRHKIYSFINISGLAIGMACCILILLFVQDELSYDGYHEKAGQIYRIVVERHAKGKMKSTVSTPAPMAPALLNDFPEIVHVVRFFNQDNPTPLVRYGDKRFYEKRFFFTDANVFDVFPFPLIRGSAQTALQEPFSVVITEEMARKYFGDEDPLGKVLTFKNWLDLKITGVLQNLPPHSHRRFDFLASFATLEKWLGKDFMSNWYNNMCRNYVLLPRNYPAVELEKRFPTFIGKYFGEDTEALGKLYLQPLKRIHLYSKRDYGMASAGDIQQIYILSTIACFVLLIACINSMNLSTASSAQRAKEVGIRKVVGARRMQLVRQFLGETLLLAFIALLLAIALVELTLPLFNGFTGKELMMDYRDIRGVLGLGGIVLLVGIVAGSYPAFFLAAFQPVEILPGGPVGQMTFRAESSPVHPDPLTMRMLWVDHDFIETLGIELGPGRNFSKDHPTDATEAFILNETAVKQLGWESPGAAIGKPFERIYGPKPDERVTGRIIGVAKDFHFRSLRFDIEPLVIHLWPWLNYIIVRVQPDHVPSTLAFLERTWQKFDPNHPFEYYFLDDRFASLYRAEESLGQISGAFATLAIFVACLGLFGLAAFTAEQRTKEIGIRKVLGASISGIVLLLSKEFTKLVLVSNLIAWPIAYWAMNRWLQDFAYRIHIGVGTFLLAGVLALIIALLTVSFQAIKAALANPVKALRYE